MFSPRATSAEASVNVLWIPYDFWSLGLFVLVVVIALTMLAGRRAR